MSDSKQLELLTVNEIANMCQEQGIRVCKNTVKKYLDCDEILGVQRREKDNGRLTPRHQLPKIMSKLEELSKAQNGAYTLKRLAESVCMNPMRIYQRAQRLGIESKKVGTKRVLSYQEFCKWRIILIREKLSISTGYIAKRWGVRHADVDYGIVKKVIPAVKIGGRYRTLKSLFNKHGEKWRARCGYGKS